MDWLADNLLSIVKVISLLAIFANIVAVVIVLWLRHNRIKNAVKTRAIFSVNPADTSFSKVQNIFCDHVLAK